MLIYHPVYDINHCIYRILRFLSVKDQCEIHWDKLRMLDFYSVFPHLLKRIKPFPKELNPYRKIVNRIPDCYEAMPNEKRVFHEMLSIQNTAIHNLVAKNLVCPEKFIEKIVSRTVEPLPVGLISTVLFQNCFKIGELGFN